VRDSSLSFHKSREVLLKSRDTRGAWGVKRIGVWACRRSARHAARGVFRAFGRVALPRDRRSNALYPGRSENLSWNAWGEIQRITVRDYPRLMAPSKSPSFPYWLRRSRGSVTWSVTLPNARHAPLRADTPTRRYADTPIRRYADTLLSHTHTLTLPRLVRSRSIGNQVSSWFPGRKGYDHRR